MELNSIESILMMACAEQRAAVEFVLRLQGYLPFYGKESYGKIDADIRARGIALCVAAMVDYKDCKFAAVKGQILKKYLPDLREDYLSSLLGIRLDGRTRFNLCGFDYIFDDKSGKGRIYKVHTKEYHQSIYFLSKHCGKSIYDILDDYYRWLYGSKSLASLVASYLTVHATSVMETVQDASQPRVISATAPMAVADACEKITPETWMPEKLNNDKSFFVSSFARDNKGYITDHKGAVGVSYVDKASGKSVYGTMYGDLPAAACKRIDECKDWLVARGMDKAINAPRWRIDYRRGCIVYNGVYTLSGKAKRDTARNAMPCRVAELRRYMQPHNGKLKEFAKGSNSIPYLLDNLSLRDKVLVVCEGVPDACFVKNGVAINCWKPSTDTAQPIIDYFEREKKMQVYYITDNWVSGDKGGKMALEWYQHNAPDTMVFDWERFTDDYKTASKDVGELVMEMVQRGDGRFIVGGKYQMPRELIMQYCRPAKDIAGLYEYNLDSILAI